MQIDFRPFLDILQKFSESCRIYNLKGSSLALLLALYDKPFLVVELTEELAEELFKDINFFREALKKEQVFFLPENNGPSLSGERAKIIYFLKEKDSLVSSFRNQTSIIWDKNELQWNIINLKKGMEIKRSELEGKLHLIGYEHVPLVVEKGEFSRRGWLLDIFPSTSESPLRIEFFGDEIESIKTFEVDTQRTLEHVSEFLIFPAKDPVSGITLLEMMNGRRYFFSDSIQERHGLPENSIFFSKYSFEGPGYNARVLSIKGLGILPEERRHIEELPQKIKNLQRENRIAIISSSKGQAERLKNILRDVEIIAPVIEKKEIFEFEGRISITVGELSSGLFLPGILILTEKELFGGRPGYRPIKKSKVSRLLTSIDDLKPGDFIVHKEHGIGTFKGLVRQSIEGTEEDLMLIEYEGGRLYLPLQRINNIHKYHSEEGITPKIDRLGSKTWQRTKEKVKKKVHELAEKLISLHAEREIYKGFSFSPDTELHYEFESFFPYEETPDQLKAIEDIKSDMESEKPMDRLICGDVGYGKTEVAMRAAFKAVYDGMQVAVLVPTTILCEQHYRIFKTRFSAFPVNIDFLSRFKSKNQQKETIKALYNGDIDIIIGTHSLLGKEVNFHKLGLLIIDEEHRFGVRQKEKIKELKKGVDVLVLTATPIPRTLHMALSDIRDMSLIETPPEERLAVKSAVSIFDKELIRETIKRECDRNGQVFFVHNRITDIYKFTDYLKILLPLTRIAVAHGQMAEKELEKVMHAFYEQKLDVLVSTAIIGSGLDIPTANTIIINRADLMGLADLYQLKGRVGRGNVRAYAYFLIPGEDIITEEAKKRLQAIQEMSYLGAGFRLALKDLEIRGAGNLLGVEQSGHIHAVGFDLYMEMIEKAVAELKGVKIEGEFEPVISLKVRAFIPEEYIDDVTLRLSLYRRIASSKTSDALKAMETEMEDRFGKIPVEVKNLLHIMNLKIMARDLFITKIQDVDSRIHISFSPETKIELMDIFELNQKLDLKVRFLPDGFEFDIIGLQWEEVFREISEILHELRKSTSLLV
jgi:transcription-repair coupling factor (superfamily II helicase)